MKLRLCLLIFLISLLGFAGLSRSRETPPITVPEEDRSRLIKFSHKYHLTEIGAKCTDCHTAAPTSDRATDRLLPKKADCAQCHDVEDKNDCQKCHVDTTRLVGFQNPERVIDFPHRFHIEKVGLVCVTCHVGLEETDYASRASWPGMDDCLACHDNLKAPFDCEICHPKVEVIRPQTHRANFIHEHKEHVRSQAMPCAKCHEESYCQECHLGARLTELKSPSERAAPSGPQDRGRVTQIIQRQHELNYRFTHPLDAVGKERQCATCHDTKAFCADCHRAAGADDRRLKPIWHGDAGGAWVLGRVGSGGRHAEWARRDIERCMSCHDTEGADPSCLQCHVDFDGRRGTDPKTHDRYVGRDDDWGFHKDAGTVCFTCHANTKRAGAGFCGYCHGAK